MGLAPTGHTVTAAAPTSTTVTVQATLVLDTGYIIAQVTEPVTMTLTKYIKEIQNNWENSGSTLTIYTAKMIAAILTVIGIANVSGIKINNIPSDLTLTETATTQQFPYLGEVTLDES